jgi:ferredoxin
VDKGICIGCGLCTTRCSFDAISITKNYDAWPVPYEKILPHLAKNMIAREFRIIKRKITGEDR